ncbi:MAG: calcium-binding protein [Pseudomonadota bacterium]
MTITPTTGPDILTGTSGNDTIDALAGNDTINGGVGNDTLLGNDGDDTFIVDEFFVVGPNPQSDIFNGGSGTDTLELRPLADYTFYTSFGAYSPHVLLGSQTLSVERLSFASTADQAIAAYVPITSGFTSVVGGAGRDFLAYITTGAGSYTLPSLSLSNWSAPLANGWDTTVDLVALVANGTVGQTVTLNAASGLNAMQSLIGTVSNDTLNGSANADYLGASTGTDQLFGNGGNDTLGIINQNGATSVITGAGSLFDGGTGTDLLTIGGYVNFQGTLTAMEGVNLLPAQTTGIDPIFGPFGRASAVLKIDNTVLAMLPASATFRGTGTVIVNLDDNVGFNGSAFQIEGGSAVAFEINAGAGNVSLIGTSTADTLAFGLGTQSATGGAGADAFRIGFGTHTITDFADGTDKLDFSHTDVYIGSRLLDFVSDGPNGTTFALTSGGNSATMLVQGIALSSLSGDDVILADGNFANTDTGTTLADIMMGGALNDNMSGGDGNDRFYTGDGADTITGGNGDDTIVVDGVPTVGIQYDGGAGTDTLLLRYNEAAQVAPTTGLPTSTIQLLTTAPNKLVGIERIAFDSLAGEGVVGILSRDNFLASGVNTLIGGDGSDALVLFVTASGAYTTPNLTLTDWQSDDTIVLVGTGAGTFTLTARAGLAGAQTLIGADGNDTLTGTTSFDTLMGGAGADTIVSGGGADHIYGGAGDDVFTVSAQAALVFESADEGTDSVTSSTGFYLYQNIENLALAGGAGNIFGVGNDLDNTLTGNEGQNLLIGGAGNDTLYGGLNIDALFGQDGTDTLYGEAGIDYLVGGADGDTLYGGADADALYGEDGNDLIYGGDDFVTDIMVGGNGNDTLYGNSGQADYDLMDGAAGNDTYYVDTGDDLTFEALNGGTDTVYANVGGSNNGVYLYQNVESLVLTGTTTFGVGNELANSLDGNASGNWLLGGAGNDTIHGGAGNDVLFGQGGNDTFVFEAGTGGDVIGDFAQGQDKIQLDGIFSTFAQAQANFVQVGTDGAINLGAGDLIVLHSVTMANLTAADFLLI